MFAWAVNLDLVISARAQCAHTCTIAIPYTIDYYYDNVIDDVIVVCTFLECLYPMQEGFLEKNNDALHASLEQLIAVSKDPFIKKLFPEAVKPSGGVNTKKLVLISVGSKFRV